MSENLQSDINEAKCCDNDDRAAANFDTQQSLAYEKQQLLVEKANNTFKELCKTLENEQTKLLELEEKRKALQEEMLLLKAEIEEEKKSFNSSFSQSIAENLNAINKTNQINDSVCEQRNNVEENLEKSLYTCHEEDDNPLTIRNFSEKNSEEFIRDAPTVEENVQYIRSELHNVVTQCMSEQCGD